MLLDAALLDAQSSELGAKMMELEAAAHELAGQPFNLEFAEADPGDIVRASCGCRSSRRRRAARRPPTRKCSQKLAAGLPAAEAAARIPRHRRSSSRPTPTSCRAWSTRRPGRVHTNYAQAVAVTGRLSINDPNLQNIPVRTAEGRRIREAFIAPAGQPYRVGRLFADRAAHHGAYLAGREPAASAFAAGEDIHRATAAEIFGVEPPASRRRAAALRQGDQFRPDLRHVRVRPGRASLGIERAAAQQIHRSLFRALSGRRANTCDETREQARERAATSKPCSAGACGCRKSTRRNGPRRQGAERAAINAPMQGTAADLIKLAMIAVQRLAGGRRLASDASSCRCTTNWCSKCRMPKSNVRQDEAAAVDGGRGAAGGAAGGGRRRRPQLGKSALSNCLAPAADSGGRA